MKSTFSDEIGVLEEELPLRCNVQIEQVFEGPLDLLLYLIRRDELDIYDIPISYIADQYIRYLERMKAYDIRLASEYLVMASTLLNIKARMLLPSSWSISPEETTDPREKLTEMLLARKYVKELAADFKGKLEEESRYLPATNVAPVQRCTAEGEVELDWFQFIEAFYLIMRQELEELPFAPFEEIKIEERMEYLLGKLGEKKRVRFDELLTDIPNRLFLVATFIALLELMRLNEVTVRQTGNFGRIWIYRRH